MTGSVATMRSRRWGVRALALAAVFGLVASACGGDDSGGPATTQAPTTTAAGGDATTTTVDDPDDTVAPDEPVAGGEIVVATLFDSFGFDPTKVVGGIADGTVANAVFEALLRYDENNEVAPWLAESIETEDSQVYVLKTRPGAVFSDGTPVDAEAVKFNIERHQDISLRSRGILNALNIESMEVLDETTLELRLRFPWSAFPETLTGPLGVVGSPTAIRANPEGFNSAPVGAGPYLMTQWVPGDRIILDRNPSYYGASEGRPYLDRITLRLVLDTQTRLASARNNEVQLAQSTNGAEVEFASNGLVGFPVYGPGITVQMNTTSPPFDDVRVRRAVLQATDRETLFNVVFEGAGTFPPNNFLIGNDSEFSAFGEIDYPEYDPVAAKALVDEYEAEVGPISFTYQCHTQPDLVNMAQVVQQMWAQVGMDVEVAIKDQQAVVVDIFTKNYQISCFGATGQEDPDLAFYGILHSSSPTNTVGYSNPAVDEALDTGRRSNDPAVRRDAYLVVQQALADDVPLFQAVTSPWGWFGNESIGGMRTLRNGIFDTSVLYLRS